MCRRRQRDHHRDVDGGPRGGVARGIRTAACVDVSATSRRRDVRMIRFGIDLGGTKIEIIALAQDGRELLRRRVATPKENYGEILDAVAALVRDAETELADRGTVGIGTPGSISRATGLLRGSNSV